MRRQRQTIDGPIERKAYNRTKHLEDRTKMMTDWSNYLDRIKRGVKEIKLVNKDD